MRLGQRVLVQFNTVLFTMGLLWWLLLAIVHVRMLADDVAPVSVFITLVLLPAILCLVLGILLGMIIGEESGIQNEMSCLQAKQHANYGATTTTKQDWPKAVEHV